MSLQLITQYQAKLERLVQYGGSRNETSVRAAFQELLDRYAASKNLALVTELEYKTRLGTTVRPDGTLKNAVRQDVGYWESKDERDDLGAEIALKLEKGYPSSNILFDDTRQVVLIQNAQEVGRAGMDDPRLLHALLEQFVGFETPFVRSFREAIGRFQDDLPDLLRHLREVIGEEGDSNARFRERAARLLELVQKAINPHLTGADVREMLIQHLLTEEIFTSVFSEADFHRENNVARELAAVTETFFTGALKRNTLARIRPYYSVIQQAAVNIADHHEKQRFLKVVYETFYKAYNPAGADRLGIVYTPNEVVRFMVEAADHLTERHFGKLLGDPGVTILDPATGTGTFITEIIEYLPKAQLKRKYKDELFCNEVALLPYYTANLNIEATYKQKMGHYAEFENIALVDTLENLAYVGATGQFGMFELTAENLERIRRQNEQRISVVIGNPPYNANQLNENDNNKNRPYPAIDKRIQNTYIAASTAQKTKVYDMYARFLRWASDRISENGVVAFVSNNSFIDSRTFDGFRKCVAEDFNEVWIIDMKGNARTSGERRRREGGNVFSDAIRVGVAVYFLVRKKGVTGCRIYYNAVDDYWTDDQKQAYLRDNKLQDLAFKHILPDTNNNWINQSESSWGTFLPVATKEAKFARSANGEQALFKLFSLGIATNRDDWVYSFDRQTLQSKIEYFIETYNDNVEAFSDYSAAEIDNRIDYSIKWSRDLKRRLMQKRRFDADTTLITKALYRPFTTSFFYAQQGLSDILSINHFEMFGANLSLENAVITFRSGDRAEFSALATKYVPDFHVYPADSAQCLPLYRYDKSGNRLENVTNWGLECFRAHYGKVKMRGSVASLGDTSDPDLEERDITRRDIFHYVYAVLHNPAYRKTYELNLRREFPRIPFYDDFGRWAAWGKRLMKLHLGFETVEPYPLTRVDLDGVKTPKAKLKADKAAGEIVLDTKTSLLGVPAAAWDYQLGNRSGLEWVLERYRERTPKDKTVAERFNTYRFADHKEDVIVLLGRVCAVSVETSAIIAEMEASTLAP